MSNVSFIHLWTLESSHLFHAFNKCASQSLAFKSKVFLKLIFTLAHKRAIFFFLVFGVRYFWAIFEFLFFVVEETLAVNYWLNEKINNVCLHPCTNKMQNDETTRINFKRLVFQKLQVKFKKKSVNLMFFDHLAQ